MRKQFSHIGSLLDDKMSNAPWARQVKIGLMLEFVEQIFKEQWGGAAIDQQVKVVSLKSRTLTIKCTNSIIAQEIRLYEQQILNKLIKKFGKVVDKMKIIQ